MAEMWFSNDENGAVVQVVLTGDLYECFLQDGREIVFDADGNGLQKFLAKGGFLTLREIRVL